MQLLLIAVSVGATSIAARHFFREGFLLQIDRQLQDLISTVVKDLPPLEQLRDPWCAEKARGSSFRVSAILSVNGKDICDSHYNSADLPLLADRAEVISAIEEGSGKSVREASYSFKESAIYSTRLVADGKLVLRVGVPLSLLRETMSRFDRSLASILAVIGFLVAAMAAWHSGILVSPIGRALEKAVSVLGQIPLGAEGTNEWARLESSLEAIQRVRQSEIEEHSALMGNLPEAVLALDTAMNPLFYNSKLAMHFSLSAVLENGAVRSKFEQVLSSGEATVIHEFPSPQAGTDRTYSVSISPLKRENSAVYGAMAIFHEITELKRAERQRTDFVANASHELRTPLASVKGFADTILAYMDQGKPIEKTFVERIAKNSDRLLGLVNHMLEISELESGRNPFNKEDLVPREFSERVVKQLESVTGAKSQVVEVRADVGVVHADPTGLEQVLVNLIGNASKYSFDGSEIKVTWRESQEAVILEVSDNGPGIAPEHQSRLFERFYRVDKARSRKVGGSGLGLAIVKHIVQGHGGRVSLKSALDEGTTVKCEFPKRLCTILT